MLYTAGVDRGEMRENGEKCTAGGDGRGWTKLKGGERFGKNTVLIGSNGMASRLKIRRLVTRKGVKNVRPNGSFASFHLNNSVLDFKPFEIPKERTFDRYRYCGRGSNPALQFFLTKPGNQTVYKKQISGR
jgi:hypothetical protein